MSEISNHRKAMECCDYALLAKRNGDTKEALQKFRQALDYEMEHAMAVVKMPGLTEPSRSILLKSAAWLAIDVADMLLQIADTGDPSPVRGEIIVMRREIASMSITVEDDKWLPLPDAADRDER